MNSQQIQYIWWIIYPSFQAETIDLKCVYGNELHTLIWLPADGKNQPFLMLVTFDRYMNISFEHEHFFYNLFSQTMQLLHFHYNEQHILFWECRIQKGWDGKQVKHESELLSNIKQWPKSSQQQWELCLQSSYWLLHLCTIKQ